MTCSRSTCALLLVLTAPYSAAVPRPVGHLTISAFIELDQVGPSPERPAIEVRVRGR